MKASRDPEHAELSHIQSSCKLAGKSILEIGCGDGKLSRQYEGSARRFIGIDPLAEDLKVAREIKCNPQTHFVQAVGEKLPFQQGVFDIVIFASSL